ACFCYTDLRCGKVDRGTGERRRGVRVTAAPCSEDRPAGACGPHDVSQDASTGVLPGSKGDADPSAKVGEALVMSRQPCVRHMVQHDRQTHPPGELIPALHTLPEQQPGAEDLALRGRSVEMPIVAPPAQAASDEEPLGQREQRAPGTTAPGQ